MIDAVVSEHVNAPADRVRALYRDPDNWARLFPATIRGARVVRMEGDTTVVEVDHVEGKAVNILRDASPTRIDLVEFKRRYDATFVNEFIPEGEGMRYTLTASVQLKWPYRLAAPLVKPMVLANAPICRGPAQSGGRKRALEARATHHCQDTQCLPLHARRDEPARQWTARDAPKRSQLIKRLPPL